MSDRGHVLSAHPGYPDLSRLSHARAATVLGNAKAFDAVTSMRHITVPKGKVAIITRLLGNAGGLISGTGGSPPFYLTAPSIATPATSNTVLYQTWSAGGGSPTGWFPYMPILNFDRNDEVFGSPALSLPVDYQLDWQPRHPIVIPSESEFGVSQESAIGNKVMAYGYIVDSEDARSMGFEITDRASPTSSFNRLVQTGRVAESGEIDLIGAQAGFTIQIMDVFARLQPLAAGAAAMTLADETGTVFKFRNDSQANNCEWKFSPGIYLRADEKLTLEGDATSAGRGTVCVIARYVPNSEVPDDAYWSYLEPALTSPAGVVVAGFGRRASSTFTLNYSGPATTGTTPGQGRRHHVEGFTISATKDATASSDHVWFAITTGDAGGAVGAAALAVVQVNDPISPVLTLSLPHQSVNLSVDGLNVPCVSNNGLIMFEAIGVQGNLAATPTGEGDIQGWGATVWGRTLPTEVAQSPNPQFDGGVSAT